MKKRKITEEWKKEWKDMPEFVMEDLSSYKKVTVHFRNEEDFQEFCKLINQPLKKNGMTISTWYPPMEPRRYSHLRYTNENES